MLCIMSASRAPLSSTLLALSALALTLQGCLFRNAAQQMCTDKCTKGAEPRDYQDCLDRCKGPQK